MRENYYKNVVGQQKENLVADDIFLILIIHDHARGNRPLYGALVSGYR